MHGPRPAVADHFPHLRVLPRFKRAQVHRDPTLRQRRFHIAHGRQPALREHINLHQADDFHGIHVEVRGGVALVGNEGRRQLMHGLA